MDNKSFTIKCDNCGNEVALVDKIDAFLTQVQIVATRDFLLQINCENCGNSIETE